MGLYSEHGKSWLVWHKTKKTMPDKEFSSSDNETRPYSTFVHTLSYAIDFRALSFRGTNLILKTGQNTSQDWWDWLEIWDTFGFIENNARQRVFFVGQWNPATFNVWPCFFICHWLQGSIFSRDQNIAFLRPARTGETGWKYVIHLVLKKTTSDKEFSSEDDENWSYSTFRALSFLGIKRFNF